jgi:S1-C subfamily serine protease
MSADAGRAARSFRRSLVGASLFALGAVVGSRVTQTRVDDARAAASEVVRVSGAEAARAAIPLTVGPLPRAIEDAASNGGAWSGRRVAADARAITAMIRGNQVYGAGIVIGERHVLTCLHVVESMKTIELSVAEAPVEGARIVARDAKLDLAVLETDGRHDRVARLASITEVAAGDRVFAMGAPEKMTASLNSGIVSYVGRAYSEVLYLQTDVPTNAGNSGGPVLDDAGRVIGVSSFILRDTQGLAFATPIDYAYRSFAAYFADRLELEPFDAWVDERRPVAR